MTDHRPHLHAVAAEALQGPPEPWTGIRPPRRRGGSSRFLTDVLVELGYVDQARVAHATDKARATGSASGARAPGRGRDHARAAVARRRRALRPRSPRSRRVQGRHGRGQPAVGVGGKALLGGAGRLRRRAHGDGRDVRPRERAGGRRHRADDAHGRQAGGRVGRGHRGVDLADEPLRGRRPGGGRRGRRGLSGRDRRSARFRRGRAGDQARALDHRAGRRARRLGHPLRATARRPGPIRPRDASADARRRRADRGHDGAQADGRRRGVARSRS